MARFLIFLWLSPVVLFALWIGLSSLDWSLGLPFMTRIAHDRVFYAYEMLLGFERQEILALIRNALLLDVAILGGILLWRRHKAKRASAPQMGEPVQTAL